MIYKRVTMNSEGEEEQETEGRRGKRKRKKKKEHTKNQRDISGRNRGIHQ